ncbi:MAG: tRNA lysidine(34) synthetase TilS [Aeromonas sp.]
MPDAYAAFLAGLPPALAGEPMRRPSALRVAFSGGLDSSVLLAFCARWAREQNVAMDAVHVHHGLSPQAEAWAAHCAAVCAAWAVPLVLKRVQLPQNSGESLEALARRARYQALTVDFPPGAWLLTAHHQDDQLETLLLALKRGAGVRGLAGILPQQPYAGGYLMRPLLGISRAELEVAAAELQLGWISDESNHCTLFDRNYLRHQVVPTLTARWPQFARAAARSQALCAEQELLLAELAAEDLADALSGQGDVLISALAALSPARRNNALRAWLRQQGALMPAREQLARLWHEVALARADANPVLKLGSGASAPMARRFAGRLYVLTPPAAGADASTIAALAQAHCALQVGQAVALPAGLGSLQLSAGENGVLRAPRSDEPLSVRFAVPAGSLLQPQGRAGRRKLKKLLQEYAVPPWQRGRLPILFYGEAVAAVLGVFICAPFAGHALQWQLTPTAQDANAPCPDHTGAEL